MIKKFLFVWLVITLLVTPVFSAEFTDVSDEEPYFEQLGVLDALGIISSKDDSAFRPNETMTKGEFTSLIVHNLMRLDTDSEIFKQIFTDVPKSHKYAADIYSAYRMGIVIGNSEQFYGADYPVKTGEAIKILINALGYSAYAEAKGGFPMGYMMQANILKLLNGVPADVNTELKRYEVALMLYNSLKTDVMFMDSIGSDVNYGVTKGQTVMTEFLECNAVDGIVTRVRNSGLTNPELTLSKNEIYIGSEAYNTGSVKAEALLGYKVRAYYSISRDSDEKTLIYIAKNGNTEVTIQAEYIYDYDNFTITYKIDNYDMDYRNIKIPNTADFILNGKAWPDAPSSGVLTEYGTVTLVDNQGGSRYNVILVNSYEDYVVSSISLRDMTVYSQTADTSGSKILNLYNIEDERLKIFDAEGQPVLFNSIKEDDVLTVKMSSDKKDCEILISSEKITGSITEINDDEIEIDYLPKTIVPAFKNEFNTLEVGFKGTFYIDIFGGVAGVVTTDDENFKYGYLVGVVDVKGLDKEIRLKIFTKDGQMIIAEASKNLTINDVTNQKPSVLLSTFITATDGISHTAMQLVKYRIDGENVLKEITAGSDFIEEVSITKSTKWYQESRSFGSLVMTSSNTVWFVVPKAEGAAANNVTEQNFSGVVNLSDSYEPRDEEFYAYDIDDGGVAAAVIRKTGFSTESPIGGLPADEPAKTNSYVMVHSISRAVNQDGETVPKINFMERGAMTGYVVKNENTAKKYQYKLLTNADGNLEYEYNSSTQDGDSVLLADESLPPKFVERGDIIQYKLNDAQEIVGIKVVHDISRETSGYEKMILNSDGQKSYPNKHLMRSGEDRGYVYGIVKSQKNGFIRVEAKLYDSTNVYNLYAYNVKASPITIYDMVKNEIYKGSFGDITDEKTAGTGSKVFIHNHWYRTSEVFIFKNLAEKP